MEGVTVVTCHRTSPSNPSFGSLRVFPKFLRVSALHTYLSYLSSANELNPEGKTLQNFLITWYAFLRIRIDSIETGEKPCVISERIKMIYIYHGKPSTHYTVHMVMGGGGGVLESRHIIFANIS